MPNLFPMGKNFRSKESTRYDCFDTKRSNYMDDSEGSENVKNDEVDFSKVDAS